MQNYKDEPLTWEIISHLKAETVLWQDEFTQKCTKALRETGSLGDDALCAESTRLENRMYEILDMEKALRQQEALLQDKSSDNEE